MARFEAVALGCLALMIVVALLFARSGSAGRRARKPGELSGADVSLFPLNQRHPDHQPQGHGHSHHDGSGHGNVHDGGHAGVDAGHAGVDAGHAGIDGGGGGGGVH